MTRPVHPALLWHLSRVGVRIAILNHAHIQTLTLLTLTGLGFALRLQLLASFPLREDEAIYGYWARAAFTDPYFLHIWPDKPPLFIWLLSGAFALLGPSAASARWVSIVASTLTIPLVAMGALRLWHSRTAALLAAMLITLNPYAVSFAPTAYTDSLLVLLGTGAMVLALGKRGLGAGLLLGAACMTKQQGIFYVPLIVTLLWSADLWRIEQPWRVRFQAFSQLLTRLLLGVALIVLPILLWDSQRWSVAPSPWDLAQQTYAPLSWLPPQQWFSRWNDWREWLWYLGGSGIVWVMLGVAGVMAMTISLRRPPMLLLIGWGSAFFVAHLISSVQVWDRYLLPLAPWLAWLASGPLAQLLRAPWQSWSRRLIVLLVCLGLIGLVRPALDAAQGQIPIGGDHGDYTGLTAAIAWVANSEENPAHSPLILYHQALGWHFRFYLYDELQPQGDDPSRIDLRWFPSAAYLADNAAKSPYPPKYLLVPEWATPRDLALHLALRGLELEPRLQAGRFTILEVIQPMRPLCDWCISSLATGSFTKSDPVLMPYKFPLPVTPQMSTPRAITP
jgi:4-amino-4-deoxy-L-arabinose transferase-like glycosyltransferase